MKKSLLKIKKLSVGASGKQIIKNLSLEINTGELHVLMGPNGSGKSTVAFAIMGHPGYHTRAQELSFQGRNIKNLTPDARARLGLFLGFQYPTAVSGVTLAHLLPAAMQSRRQPNKHAKKKNTTGKHLTLAKALQFEKRTADDAFRRSIDTTLDDLKLPKEIIYRSINEGFSGGERKKTEILQMTTLMPKLAILDEPDSGLDIDALKNIARAISRMHRGGMAMLLITHYPNILKYLRPDAVHVVDRGTIVRSGTMALARRIAEKGYIKISTSHVARN